MIARTVRKGTVAEQDRFRRADMLQMTPAARLDLLVHARDKTFPYAPLQRVAKKRKLT